MNKFNLLCFSVILLLSGCANKNDVDTSDCDKLDDVVIFDTRLPVLTVNGVDYKIGTVPTEVMFISIKDYYKSKEQFDMDYNAMLSCATEFKKFRGSVTEDDAAFYSIQNQTRIIFGGQVSDGSYLEFTIANLADENLPSRECTVINTSVIYGDTIEEVKLDGKDITSKNDFIELLGESYSVRDVREYDYIYSYMYSYDLDEAANITFLLDGSDNVVGIQENDIGVFLNKFAN